MRINARIRSLRLVVGAAATLVVSLSLRSHIVARHLTRSPRENGGGIALRVF